MNTELSPREERLVERKNRAIDALSVQFSRNAMPIEEYERLVEYINKAESERELTIIEKIVDESATFAGIDQTPASAPRTEYRSSAPKDVYGLNYMGFDFFGDGVTDITILSSREFSGGMLAEKPRSLCTLFGNTSITVHEGDLPSGKTVVTVVSLMGNVIISVPQSIAVTMEANAFLGNAAVEGGDKNRGARMRGCPELVVRGCAFLGNLIVRIR
ncbi:MAG: cell wall-active antibiotics response protein [Treponema sp.]|jgi:hypothetical protein|nr:cell wall-active antibiotics response protein [Treponema sp.]